jgi:hypothetical protein
MWESPVLVKVWFMASLLIVYPTAFAGECTRLMNHKQRTGLVAYTLELPQGISGEPGRDDSEKLKHAIYTASRDHRDVRYVLLVGDAFRIPVRHRRTALIPGYNGSPYAQWFTVADLYYSNLYLKHVGVGIAEPGSGFSTWDANRDGFYDEHHWKSDVYEWNPDQVDGCPDVAVGRIPAHTVDQVRTYVDKVIAYETGPGAPAQVVCLADKHYQNPPSLMDGIVSGSGIAGDLSVAKLGFGFAPNDTMPAGYTQGTPPLTENAARKGAFLIYLGHGSVDSWDKETEGASTLLGGNAVDGFTSGTLPFVVSVGCSTGNWAPNGPGDDNPPYQDNEGIIHSYSTIQDANPGAFTVTDDQSGSHGRHQITWSVADINAPRVPVPVPAEYDFDQPSKSFALHWLFNGEGGGIAFCGETTVGPDNWGADFTTGMLRDWRGSGTLLGDMWLAGGRSYWQMHEKEEDAIGAPRCYLTYMTLFGDPSLRLRIRPSALPPAPDVHQVWSDTWTPGWSSLVPITSGGDCTLFSYAAESGEATLAGLNTGGLGTTPLWSVDWPVGFSSVEPVYLDSSPYLFAYDAYSGSVAIYPLAGGAASATHAVWSARWTTGWTTIVPLYLNGQAHLLEYKAGDGTVAIDRINEGGAGTTEVWRARWDLGWTSMIPITLEGKQHLLRYCASTGEVSIDRVDDAGQGTIDLWTGTWPSGPTTICSFGLLREFLIYKPADGTTAIDLVDGTGSGTEELWRAIWGTDWTTITSFSLQVGEPPAQVETDTYCIRYNAATGDISIVSVGTYRVAT